MLWGDFVEIHVALEYSGLWRKNRDTTNSRLLPLELGYNLNVKHRPTGCGAALQMLSIGKRGRDRALHTVYIGGCPFPPAFLFRHVGPGPS